MKLFPMKNKAILLVHGMGKHTAPKDGKPGSFGKEFTDATTATLQQFAKHEDDTLAGHADIHEFNFDGWFDKMRTEMAKKAKDMKSRLAAISQAYGASLPLDLAGPLTDLEAKFGDDKFFYTHWLDVIFYGTLLGAKVRVDAALKITELVENYGGGNVHIIAHSLGTAVTHDTLHLLYRREHDPDDEIPDLGVVKHKLASVWMFANVSRLVNSVTRLTNPLGSVVRPGPADIGCTLRMHNVRHALDPFTWLARFDPRNDESWIPATNYNLFYRNIVTDLIVEANTHSFTQYVRDPKVVERLLPLLMESKFKPAAGELDRVAADYVKGSINGAYAALEDSLKDAIKTPGEISGWRDFLDTAKKFRTAVKNIEDNL